MGVMWSKSRSARLFKFWNNCHYEMDASLFWTITPNHCVFRTGSQSVLIWKQIYQVINQRGKWLVVLSQLVCVDTRPNRPIVSFHFPCIDHPFPPWPYFQIILQCASVIFTKWEICCCKLLRPWSFLYGPIDQKDLRYKCNKLIMAWRLDPSRVFLVRHLFVQVFPMQGQTSDLPDNKQFKHNCTVKKQNGSRHYKHHPFLRYWL